MVYEYRFQWCCGQIQVDRFDSQCPCPGWKYPTYAKVRAQGVTLCNIDEGGLLNLATYFEKDRWPISYFMGYIVNQGQYFIYYIYCIEYRGWIDAREGTVEYLIIMSIIPTFSYTYLLIITRLKVMMNDFSFLYNRNIGCKIRNNLCHLLPNPFDQTRTNASFVLFSPLQQTRWTYPHPVVHVPSGHESNRDLNKLSHGNWIIQHAKILRQH